MEQNVKVDDYVILNNPLNNGECVKVLEIFNMKNLHQFVNEQNTFKAFRVNQDYQPEKYKYSCHPKDKKELYDILIERLAEDKNADLNDIDVSKITDMAYLFISLNPYDIDISEWNVSVVETMHCMFTGCENFNCDLSNWDVSSVTNISHMFHGCEKFEGKGLENWNVSKVDNSDMFGAFYGCKSMKRKPRWYNKTK